MGVSQFLGWITALIDALDLRGVIVGLLVAFATVAVIHELRGR
jgi:hypothetical protein